MIGWHCQPLRGNLPFHERFPVSAIVCYTNCCHCRRYCSLAEFRWKHGNGQLTAAPSNCMPPCAEQPSRKPTSNANCQHTLTLALSQLIMYSKCRLVRHIYSILWPGTSCSTAASSKNLANQRKRPAHPRATTVCLYCSAPTWHDSYERRHYPFTIIKPELPSCIFTG